MASLRDQILSGMSKYAEDMSEDDMKEVEGKLPKPETAAGKPAPKAESKPAPEAETKPAPNAEKPAAPSSSEIMDTGKEWLGKGQDWFNSQQPWAQGAMGGGLAGVLGGAGVSAFSGGKKKNWLRNMLLGGLLGAGTGAGAMALAPHVNKAMGLGK